MRCTYFFFFYFFSSFFLFFFFFFLMIRRPPRSPLFPSRRSSDLGPPPSSARGLPCRRSWAWGRPGGGREAQSRYRDRKSTRLNSSHLVISYAVFCLKKKKKII